MCGQRRIKWQKHRRAAIHWYSSSSSHKKHLSKPSSVSIEVILKMSKWDHKLYSRIYTRFHIACSSLRSVLYSANSPFLHQILYLPLQLKNLTCMAFADPCQHYEARLHETIYAIQYPPSARPNEVNICSRWSWFSDLADRFQVHAAGAANTPMSIMWIPFHLLQWRVLSLQLGRSPRARYNTHTSCQQL